MNLLVVSVWWSSRGVFGSTYFCEMAYFTTFVAYSTLTQANFCVVSFGTASCAWLLMWWCWYLLMLIVLIWVLNMYFLIYVVDKLYLRSLFVWFSSILLDKVAAFSIAFVISGALFSVRLVSVNNRCLYRGAAWYHLISDIIIGIGSIFTMENKFS